MKDEIHFMYLTKLLDLIEAKYSVKLFYSQEKIPAEKVSVSFGTKSVIETLNSVLDQFNLKAIVYKENLVVIADQEQLDLQYSTLFFDAISKLDENAEQNSSGELIVVGSTNEYNSTGFGIIDGRVIDYSTQEPIISAVIDVENSDVRSVTDVEGRFRIKVPIGRYRIVVQSVGFEEKQKRLIVKDNGFIQFEMHERLLMLDEITIFSDGNNQQLTQNIPGLATLDPKMLKLLPSFMGEPDIVKSVLYLPGVSTIGEGATGFNVQGGNTDENLILLGNSMMFNVNHVFGFFGAVNTALVKNMKLYKGIMPAYYGGRLSSALDIELKDGSTDEFKMEGGIGPFTGKITLEVPLKKEKSSIIIGGRSSHSDYALKLINIPEIQNSSVFFYDVNLKYSNKFSERFKLTGSLYSSKDDFRLSDEFAFTYGTNSVAINLTNQIKSNLTSYLDLSYSTYTSSKQDLSVNTATQFDTSIDFLKVKEQLTYEGNERFRMDIGGSAIFYKSKPGSIYSIDDVSNIKNESLSDEYGIESALFIHTSLQLNGKLALNVGLRGSFYGLLGPGEVNLYEDMTSPTVDQIISTERYEKNELISTFYSLEPRSYITYLINNEQSFKIGYSRTAQYIFQLSNTDTPFPTDAWLLSNQYLKPQRAHNYQMEYVRKSGDNKWLLSMGGYYRSMQNLKDYKNFADIIVNDHLETETILVEGRSYGLEILLNKNVGKVTGSLSYTLSRSERKSNNSNLEFSINENNWYFSNYDKPHEINFFINYSFNKRHHFSLTFNYSRGRPTTAPIGYFDADDMVRVPLYSNRNELRIPDYHRLDIIYTLGQGHRRNKRWKSSWTFGIYNVYGRENAYSVFFTQAPYSGVQANKLSILGSAFPAITYNFQFSGKND